MTHISPITYSPWFLSSDTVLSLFPPPLPLPLPEAHRRVVVGVGDRKVLRSLITLMDSDADKVSSIFSQDTGHGMVPK